jgi:hypothetical protein
LRAILPNEFGKTVSTFAGKINILLMGLVLRLLPLSVSCSGSIGKRRGNGGCFQGIPTIIKNTKNIKLTITAILLSMIIFLRFFSIIRKHIIVTITKHEININTSPG